MKIKILGLSIVVLFISLWFVQAEKSYYDNSWQQVQALEKKSLPTSALDQVEKIYATAVKEKNSPQVIKSLIYMMKFKSEKSPDAIVESITSTEKLVVETSDKVQQAVLHSMLAEMYMQYYNSESYKIDERTSIQGYIPEKIDEWSGNLFIDKFFEHLQASLLPLTDLQKCKADTYADILQLGDDSRTLRPTMFDFLSFRSLNLLENNQSSITRFFVDKKIDNKEFFADKQIFTNLIAEKKDTHSYTEKSIEIYQNLLKFHSSDNIKDATIHSDLERLKFVYNNAEIDIKDSLYLQSLSALEKEYENNPLCVEIWAEQASFYLRNTTGDINKENNVLAHEICKKGIAKFPNYKRIALLQNILTQIEQPNLNCNTQNLVYPNSTITFNISYKNIAKANLKIYKIEKSIENYTKEKLNDYGENIKSTGKLVLTKSIDLPTTKDFTDQTSNITISGLDCGIYEYEILSENKTTKASRGEFYVTKYTLLKRNRENAIEYYVLNRKTGYPEPEASIKLFETKYENRKTNIKHITTIKCNAEGYAAYKTIQNKNIYAGIVCKGDSIYPLDNIYVYRENSENENNKEIENISIFTDRSIYRPGQKMYFKAIAYNQSTQAVKSIKNKSLEIVLSDANNQEIAKKTLTTNEFGSLAGEFVLPQNVLSGYFTIRCGNQSQSFRVEEYKRPSLEINIDKITGTFSFGDSIDLKGNIMNYAGYPNAYAQIKYRILQRPNFFKRYYNYTESEITNGIIIADEKGKFSIPFVAEKKFQDRKDNNQSYNYTLYLEATDSKGETQKSESHFQIGDKTILLETDISDYIKKENKKDILISAKNLNGENINPLVNYQILKLQAKKSLTDTSNVIEKQVLVGTIDLSKTDKIESAVINVLASGKYRLKLSTKDYKNRESSSEIDFVLFSATDTKLVDKQYSFIDKQKTTCAIGENAEILFGTAADNIKVLFQVIKNNAVLESKWLNFNDELKLLEIPFKEEYGENISVQLTFVKEEQLFTENIELNKKNEEKSLDLKFTSFRDKLLPGQQEEWTIKIVDKNGKIANAELLATLYDASLDAFSKHSWSFNPSPIIPYYDIAIWSAEIGNESSSSAYFNNTYKQVKELKFDELNWFGYILTSRTAYFYVAEVSDSGNRKSMRSVDSKIMMSPLETGQSKNIVAADAVGSLEESKNEEIKQPKPIDIRKNFDETAFFYPQLKTNEKGEILLSFKIPESLTRWNFMGLAHTADLQYGQIAASTITQKPFMITANMPRFVRMEDKLNLSANVVNLTEKEINGQATLEIINPENEQIIDKQIINFNTNANSTKAVTWTYNVTGEYDYLIFKLTAQNNEFSDGEQHLLPVLPNKTLVTESLPMNISGKGNKDYKFEKLLNNHSKTIENERFSIEFSSNPAWYAVQALPSISTPENENTMSIFSAYYVNTLAGFIANSNPKLSETFDKWKNQNGSKETLLSNLEKNQELKNILLDETPWVLDAKNESEQKQQIALLFDLNNLKNKNTYILDKIKELQLPNGSFTWFKGMSEDRYVTQFVLDGISKLKKMNAVNFSQDEEKIQLSAVKYIDLCIKDDLEQLKRQSKDYKKENNLSATQIYYHYIRSSYTHIPLANGTKEAYEYYLQQMEQQWTKRNIYEQAMIAIVMQRKGKTGIAQDIIKSLRERATNNNDLGMFWDANRYGYYWSESPITTQTAIIEAFAEIVNNTSEIDNMKLWLLKQKQTQIWDSNISTINAIYALLLNGSNWLENKGDVAVSVGGELLNEKKEDGTGYFKKTYEKTDIKPALGNISIQKKDDGVAWGAAYWQYFEKMENITENKTNISISKKLFVERTNEKGKLIEALNSNTNLKIGDKVIIRLTVRTEQNMEYVCLKDLRAACFEPTEQVSAYRWREGLGYYQSTKDASMQYFFNYLPKGSYVFEYAVWVTRTGEYSNGISSIQCQYAPEFGSHTGSEKLKIE